MAASDIYIESGPNDSSVPVISEYADFKFKHAVVSSCDNHATIEYTVDKFECSLCGINITDIDMYVNHMISTEQCILFLCPSSTISNLLLPRFIRKTNVDIQKDKFTDDNIDSKPSNKTINDAVIDNVDLKLKIEVDAFLAKEAIQIEVGNGQRWKCRQCGISFSRRAAISNHFKLQHSDNENQESSAVSYLCENELKNINERKKSIKQEFDDDLSPVKNIIALESNRLLEQKQFHKAVNDITEYHSDYNHIPACNICGQIFKTMKILTAHKSIVHSDTRPFQCPYENCNFNFKTKGSLVRHERRHTGQRPFVCSKCGRSFRESGSLARHNRHGGLCKEKTDSQLPLYGKNLPFVSRYPEQKNKMNLSMKQEIGSNNLLGENDQNNKSGLSRDELKLSEHYISPRKFEDKIDIKAVKQEDNCMIQSFDHYLEGQRRVNFKVENRLEGFPLKVEEVSAESIYQNRLEEEEIDGDLLHLNRELNDTNNLELSNSDDLTDVKIPSELLNIIQWSFICPICGKSYAKKSTLSAHMNQHLDSLGNQCFKCDKTFIKQQALVRHLSSHSAYRQFICQCCNKAFKLMSHAQAHLRTHLEAKTVPCRHCGKLFKSVSSRNIHERCHSNQKPFKCFHCTQRFLTKASLIRHNRVHTNEAPFACNNCGRKFKEHGTLNRHLRNKVPCLEHAQRVKEDIKCSMELKVTNTEDHFDLYSEVPETISIYLNEND
ncbi:unnamed protein product [Meganyctiphanes norvegica]|uniref:C2H2-type domain-containing protein n=1 Tax=Meganyctiphanes norvegica TaxID=48144 RepID=A0AAV2R2G4_MEGNR